MSKLTPQQIAGAAKAAGFPDDQIATAVAVALAESGGETTATNRNTNGSVDYGIWQINTVHGSLLSQGDKFNAADNARMAYTVWQQAGRSWRPWVTYNKQRYRAFLPQGTLAAGNPDTTAQPVSSTVPTSSASPLDLLSGVLSGGLWTRIGVYILGSVMILFSLWKLTGAGDIIVQAAGMQARRVTGMR